MPLDSGNGQSTVPSPVSRADWPRLDASAQERDLTGFRRRGVLLRDGSTQQVMKLDRAIITVLLGRQPTGRTDARRFTSAQI